MIKLNAVSRIYNNTTALHPTTISFGNGKTTALIGPSGCGKSTILRLIMGLIAPSKGSIEVDGKQMTPENRQEIRRKIGYVNQDGGLFPHLTATDNVTIMARHLKLPTEQWQKRLTELCGLVRFPESGLNRFPMELSGGQRQRVGLMRALMLDPDILLMDEPLGALDPLVRASLQEDLKAVFATLHKTVLFVTHDMGEAAYLAEYIILMREGGIEQEGDVAALANSPATPFVSEFLNAHRGWRL